MIPIIIVDGWSLDIKLSATVSILRVANDTGYLASVGRGTLLANDAALYEILMGFSPTFNNSINMLGDSIAINREQEAA